ncbi:DUF2254 domain-containing protein [Bremerella sp. P1]|uniref:DUF2254 domain-containing protein n=1 Tax=Bremerella sp. P1 TaxID=3026424 RepID=UPI00236748E3|nr:DUF2254 domain-containing protein [Bremerella sp. P1]WDI44278.1 DUF2254 domain-containing protein [Bremerella sp. P1]
MLSLKKLINYWNRLQHSLWFVPVLCTLGGVVGAVLMLWIDHSLKRSWEDFFWLETTTNGAQTVLSTIAGGMITVAGVVLSMEMVTLSITSSQFGSRVLRSRLGDRTTQWTIGAFMGTAVYSLVVLKMVRKLGEDNFFIPHLSVMAAILFALGSLMILLYFIHHVAMIAQAPEIVASLATDLRHSMERIFPDKIGDPPPKENSHEREVTEEEWNALKEGVTVQSTREGYIQGIEGDDLIALATQLNLIIELPKRPGDFLSRGETLARVAALDQIDENEVARAINETFFIGNNRTPWQDVNCSVHELSQMGVRALSPGINDPYTAVNCIDRLSSALAQLAQRQMPAANRFDHDGHLRLIVDRQTFSSVMHAAFDQMRSYAISSAAVSQRLMEGYQRIADAVTHETHAEDVLHQARLTMEGALEQPHHPADLKIIQEQYERLNKKLEPLLEKKEEAPPSDQNPVDDESDEEGEASGEVIG